jgi:hypothetical protein
MPADVPVQYDYQPCWEDLRLLLDREYFACEASTYLYAGWAEQQYGYSDDEMFALLWLARQQAIPLEDVVTEYGLEGQDLDQLCGHYGIPESAWYYPVDEGCDMSTRYRTLYAAHWAGRHASIKYRNSDLIVLLHLRMACEYYGMKPQEYLRAECSGAGFHWQAQANCHRAGSTGTDCRHEKIGAAGERPWTCRDHDEWIRHQDAWARDPVCRNPLHEREIGRREREVCRTHGDAECRSRETKMREDEARCCAGKAAAAASRPEHDRQVAEYERRRDAQASERAQCQRELVEHERRMAEYDRKKSDYEKQKEDWRRQCQENERRMNAADRRAAYDRRMNDEAKQEEADASRKARESAATKPRVSEGTTTRPSERAASAQNSDRPAAKPSSGQAPSRLSPEEQERQTRADEEAVEARRRQTLQNEVDRRKKLAQENARHEEELKARGPEPAPVRYPGLRADYRPEKPATVEAPAGKGPEPRTEHESLPHNDPRAPEHHSASKGPEAEHHPTGSEPLQRRDPRNPEHDSAAKTPEAEHRPPGAKEGEHREPPSSEKQPPSSQKQPPPPPPAAQKQPPPPENKKPDSSKSSDKDKDKK